MHYTNWAMSAWSGYLIITLCFSGTCPQSKSSDWRLRTSPQPSCQAKIASCGCKECTTDRWNPQLNFTTKVNKWYRIGTTWCHMPTVEHSQYRNILILYQSHSVAFCYNPPIHMFLPYLDSLTREGGGGFCYGNTN